MTLLGEWDRQQSMYIGQREARFDALVLTIEWMADLRHRSPVVVDLGCGPAAIGVRLLDRLTGSTYIGIDQDPVLGELARRAGAVHGTEHFRFVDHDVADPGWLAHTPVGEVDVVCSSTALHWLTDAELTRTLHAAHQCLRPGGIFLNADHLRFRQDSAPDLLSAWVDDADQAAARRAGALDWDAWWALARQDPQLAPLCAARDLVYPPRPAGDTRRPGLGEFTAAMREAGFVDVGTVWQRFDDWIVAGWRAPAPQR